LLRTANSISAHSKISFDVYLLEWRVELLEKRPILVDSWTCGGIGVYKTARNEVVRSSTLVVQVVLQDFDPVVNHPQNGVNQRAAHRQLWKLATN